MFTLTYKEVAEKAKEFYLAKKLTAQHPDKSERKCVNNGAPGFRCAVAAAYPEDFKREGTFLKLLSDGEIYVANVSDAIQIQRVQDAHDTWASTSRLSEDKVVLAHLEYLFRRSIKMGIIEDFF